MDTQYWYQRWKNGYIGFHQQEVNQTLQKFFPQLNLSAEQAIFVPLCGKSQDMLWLWEQGLSVIGIEISPIAVRAFFQENGLYFEQHKESEFMIYRCKNLTLLCGDFFNLTSGFMSTAQVVYDRASLVALSKQQRPLYVKQLLNLFPGQCKILLLSLEYPESEMQGPPFSVPESEVFELFQADFNIQLLDAQNILNKETNPRFKSMTQLEEKVYLLEKRQGKMGF